MADGARDNPGDPAPEPGPPTEPDAPINIAGKGRRRRLVEVAVLVGVVLTAAIGVTLLAGDQPEPTATATAAISGETLTFTDPEAGVSLDYPGDWTTIESPDPEVVFVATPNGRDSVLVRVAMLNLPIDETTIDGARGFTSDLVTNGTGAVLIRDPLRVELDGLPGWHYLYRFTDEVSGETGIHSHYFLFAGVRMVVLVFQALPDGSFEDLATTFDDIATSLHVER